MGRFDAGMSGGPSCPSKLLADALWGRDAYRALQSQFDRARRYSRSFARLEDTRDAKGFGTGKTTRTRAGASFEWEEITRSNIFGPQTSYLWRFRHGGTDYGIEIEKASRLRHAIHLYHGGKEVVQMESHVAGGAATSCEESLYGKPGETEAVRIVGAALSHLLNTEVPVYTWDEVERSWWTGTPVMMPIEAFPSDRIAPVNYPTK